MSEVTFDKRLAVRTVGIKEWDDPVSHYNRCEPTPYRALEHLFRHYSLEASDRFVDFGSGRGRVAFYVHNRFNIPVTGVEAQEDILDEAMNNISRYRRNARGVNAPIRFEHGLAEHYEIKPQDTKFFFFNPFAASVYMQVLANIVASLNEVRREAHVILYYPLAQYEVMMENTTQFEKHAEICVPKTDDKREKFLIYRWTNC
ncbi:MAG: class I SAM-dependent methyltransferase [Lentisphaerae bacterium]|nr:class I SAM-dependent methyltransferase [Lentisphaerota bacterium]